MNTDSETKLSLEKFLKSSRPMLFAGFGITSSFLKPQIRDIARDYVLPVVSTSHAKGIFPEDCDSYYGTFGFASSPKSENFISCYEPNAILFLGTRLGEVSSNGWSKLLSLPPLKIHVDRDAGVLNRNYKVDYAICDEISKILRMLSDIGEEIQGELQELKKARKCMLEEGRFSELRSDGCEQEVAWGASPVDPGQLLSILSDLIQENAVVYSDIGNSMAWTINKFRVLQAQDLFIPLGLGAMGSGLGMAIGGKTAMPDRAVYCVVGDVSMLMHGSEVFTAAENGIGVVFIVLNDGGHGMVDHGTKSIGFGDMNVRFSRRIEFTTWADSIGVDSFKVSSLREFQSIDFGKLALRDKPTVIDVIIDKTICPPILARAKVLSMPGSVKLKGGI